MQQTGSDNDLSPVWRQAIIWYNAGILVIVMFRNDFPLAVGSTNNVYQLMSYKTTCRLYNNISQILLLCKTSGYHDKFHFTKSLEVCYWSLKRDGLKYITFYVKKHIATLAMCYNPSLVRGKPLGACAFVKLVYWTAKWQPSCLCLNVLLIVTPKIWQPKINFSVLWIFIHHQKIYPKANNIQQETDLFYYLWHIS